jgi:hypothetical protein
MSESPIKEVVDAEPTEHVVTLPYSKRIVYVSPRELTGFDREQADIIRMQSGRSESVMINALVSRVCFFKSGDDLKPMVYEDFQQMSTRDIDAILNTLKKAGDPRFFESSAGKK